MKPEAENLPIHFRAELKLTRRVAHARDAREVPRVEKVQRSWQFERRRVREVEHLDSDLELLLPPDPQLPRDAHVDLP